MLTLADILVGVAQAACAALVATCFAALFCKGLPVKKGGYGSFVVWGLLVATAAVPGLLIGYAYAPTLLHLVHYPFLRGVVYSLLIAAKVTPALTLVLALLPVPISSSGLHLLRLHCRETRSFWPIRIRAGYPGIITVFSLGFVLAFNEFEIAAILGTAAWSVSVFDAHAGGLPTPESFRLGLLTLLVQVPVIVVGVYCLVRALKTGSGGTGAEPVARGVMRLSGWGVLGIVSLFTVVLPLWIILGEAVGGILPTLSSFAMEREIFASMYLALAAASLSILAARWLCGRPRIALAASVPCLSGSLLIGLAVLGVSQQIAPKLLSGPIPVMLALAITVLPISVVLSILVIEAGRGSSSHAARLSRDGPLKWRYLVTPVLATGAFVFLIAYYEVVIPSVLAPPGMTTAFERLHNLMHYGRTTALSAMVVIAFVSPIILIGLLWWLGKGFLLISQHLGARVAKPGGRDVPESNRNKNE